MYTLISNAQKNRNKAITIIIRRYIQLSFKLRTSYQVMEFNSCQFLSYHTPG
ncbi:MAG: hypothetical protein M8352_00215 [ANME-2 cluster archaeon]|nr:hypothetical protein [ANME-2 cluster archaeon]MDF1530732.1 hypothetical protein [ANME-2 cluster archaeon]